MKNFLICIDSDGCAVDSMEIKHRRCFGPCMIEVWHLEKWQDKILNRWNEINLYTRTRGINRFLALEIILTQINDSYMRIDGIDEYQKWCREAKTFSNAAVREQAELTHQPIFEQVLSWSSAVNRRSESIGPEIRPFDGVKDALAQMGVAPETEAETDDNAFSFKDTFVNTHKDIIGGIKDISSNIKNGSFLKF